jgi:hypothetical protein
MAPHEPPGQRPQRKRADRDQQHDVIAALLPDQDAQHHAAHPHDGQDRADPVDPAVSRVRDILRSPIWASTTAMTTASRRKPTRQDR